MSTTTTTTHVGTVSEIYAAFGRGDVAFIIDHLADDVAWDQGLRSTAIPWFQPRTGKQEVGEFFSALGQGLALTTFEPQVLAADGDNVVAVVRLAGTILSTGYPVEEDLMVHRWILNGDGKVASFRHIGDLARQEIPFTS
jgi:ketosteroid isomerase-like protein